MQFDIDVINMITTKLQSSLIKQESLIRIFPPKKKKSFDNSMLYYFDVYTALHIEVYEDLK